MTPVYSASGYSAYRGATTITRCPRAASAAGSAPQTSPSPPVLDHGATSEETKTTSWSLVGFVVEAPRPRVMVGRAAAAAAATAEATAAEAAALGGSGAFSLAGAAEVEAAEVEAADEEDEGCAAAKEGPLAERKERRAGMGASCGDDGGVAREGAREREEEERERYLEPSKRKQRRKKRR